MNAESTRNPSPSTDFVKSSRSGGGDEKSTNWFSVSIWGGQAKSNFVDYLKKGQMVQVVGELSTREYSGKTYMEVRSYSCNLAGSPQNNQPQQSQNAQQGYGQQPKSQYDKRQPTSAPADMDDDLPF